MFFVTLTVDLFWVGFRTGQIFFVLAPAIVARGFVLLWRPRLKRFGVALALLVVMTGAPTTVIDAYNAQDVTNRSMGPGFHWTVVVTPAEREAFAWIKANTPPGAVVQAEPTARGRETWSLIPSFAERRMAAGLPDLAAERPRLRRDIRPGARHLLRHRRRGGARSREDAGNRLPVCRPHGAERVPGGVEVRRAPRVLPRRVQERGSQSLSSQVAPRDPRR